MIQGGRIQMFHGSDGCPLIRMLVISASKGFTENAAVGLVIDALSSFFLYHFALGIYPNLVNLGMEHSFTFQIEGELQIVGRQQLVIVGVVVGGKGIEAAPSRLHNFSIVASLD